MHILSTFILLFDLNFESFSFIDGTCIMIGLTKHFCQCVSMCVCVCLCVCISQFVNACISFCMHKELANLNPTSKLGILAFQLYILCFLGKTMCVLGSPINPH